MLSRLNNFVKPTKQKYLKKCLIRYTIKSQKDGKLWLNIWEIL
nr:MAG TPA: hypothetical protein [Caudoviricetes sp.]